MNRLLPAALVGAALTATASAQGGVWSQSIDNTTLVPGSVACSNAAGISDNSHWRRYDPIQCGLAGDYLVTTCTFGVETAATASGSTTITVNLRAANPAFPAGGTADPILGTTTVDVLDTAIVLQTFVPAVFSPPVLVPAGTVIAVEVMAPNGMPQSDVFLLGSNGLGETAPSYISAADCAVVDPIAMAAVGFPDVHWVIDLECEPDGPPAITYICDPPNANSTGLGAALTFTGNTDQSAGPYVATLTTTQLPTNQFGYYLASRTPSRPPLPVSNGLLCLAGDIARLIGPGQPGVQSSGAAGAFSGMLDPANVPTNPSRAILPGDTWYFQTWYRDQGPTGPGSNFSDACCVPFF